MGFKLVLEPNIEFINDTNICKFIYRNIIQNAIKYSHKNGVVRIVAYSKENQTVVSVSDNGIGMDVSIIESKPEKGSTFTVTIPNRDNDQSS